jgi:reticulon-3
MDSPGRSCRLFGAQRSLHDLLGGGTGELFDLIAAL